MATYKLSSESFMSFMLFISFTSLISLCLLSEACHVVDKEALLQFKSRISQDPSNILGSWTSSSHCCHDWEGITCDSTGRVINVTRTGMFYEHGFPLVTSMSGTLSPYLGNLAYLQILDLRGLQELHGGIPEEFNKLSKLETLYLDRNQLSGNVPSSLFGSMKSLSGLGLSENKLSGSIPSSIGSLTSLTNIDLHQNKFGGSIPASIGNLRNLKELDLSGNQIRGSIPESIGSLSQLGTLDLMQNKITGSLPNSIGGLSSLTFCRISENMLTGILPSSIGKLRNLQTLNLQNNKITGRLPSEIGHLTGLIDLFLSNNKFAGGFPRTIGYLINLETIYLSGNQLSGNISEELGDAKALEKIYLSNNKLSGNIPEKVINLKSLLEFDVSWNSLTGSIPPHKAIIDTSAFVGNPGLIMVRPRGTPDPPVDQEDPTLAVMARPLVNCRGSTSQPDPMLTALTALQQTMAATRQQELELIMKANQDMLTVNRLANVEMMRLLLAEVRAGGQGNSSNTFIALIKKCKHIQEYYRKKNKDQVALNPGPKNTTGGSKGKGLQVKQLDGKFKKAGNSKSGNFKVVAQCATCGKPHSRAIPAPIVVEEPSLPLLPLVARVYAVTQQEAERSASLV
ncbi:probable leucine-rich repeat receptor-like protein kinase At1g35710 [Gastrolobium bilobum]|uniref:probable leucine-rich repeat receptor-like protein kinase At1g35710 n=1 Tax=Gastrolobium bilobum TaxID=150636 RepID=UPI002AB12D31|nr:probable leucine-rich repeat receptor-like protein kinase At1g35710 [Gastrolobium bilobum]